MLGKLLERMFVSVQADFSGLKDDLGRAADDVKSKTDGMLRSFEKMGAGMQKVGKSLTAKVTLPMLAVGGAAIKLASDAEEMEAKFSTVFGHLSADVKVWADETGSALNRSKFDLMQYASTFQDTFVQMGFAREQAAELSKVVTQLGVDLASFNNEAEADTIRSLQSALIGNTETVRKYGVVITQATLDAELMNMGIEGGTKAATEQQKILARLNIILQSTTDAQGDAARTSESFANQWRGLTSQLREAGIQIGQVLLPMATKLVGVLAEWVDVFTSLSPQTQEMVVLVAGLAAAVGPLLIVLGTLIGSLRQVAVVLALVASPLGLIVTALGAVVVAFVVFRDDVSRIAKEAYDQIDHWLGGKLSETLRLASLGFRAFKLGLDDFSVGSITKKINELNREIEKAETRLQNQNIGGLTRRNLTRDIEQAKAELEELYAMISHGPNGGSPLSEFFKTGSFSGGSSASSSMSEASGKIGVIAEELSNNTEDVMSRIEEIFGSLETKTGELAVGINGVISGKAATSGDAARREGILKGEMDPEQAARAREQFGEIFSDGIRGGIKGAQSSISSVLRSAADKMFDNALQKLGSELFNILSQSGIGNFFSTIFSSIGGRAVGGVEMPGRAFIAGERGPEIITQDGPGGARRVSTAGRSAQLMRGGGGAMVVSQRQQPVNINVSVSGARGNMEIQQMVDTGVATGLKQYDKVVAGRVSIRGRREG